MREIVPEKVMLRDVASEGEIEVGPVASWGSERSMCEPDWRRVDRALRTIRRRATLDAEEARWLREAEALQIWRPLGMVSALDYMERVLGYAPRTAQDRLRVARALGDLPQLTAALAADELAFSAVRELTRVATPGTEASWIAAAAGKNLRQLEELVADHRPGDRPDDPPDPQARTHVVRLELAAETFALLRQVRTVLDDEHGTNLADDEFVAALCSAVLDGASSTETTGRAKYQIAVTVCQRCRQGWQEGAGAQVAIEPAAVDRAMCDAQHLGSIDGSAPDRAHQDIPPSTARLVWRRDGGRCRVPGCRSARGLEIHHLVHRADGGSHEASNLCLLCSACHLAHHRGALAITGTADQLEVRRPGHAPEVGGPILRANSTTPIIAVNAEAHVDACAAARKDASGLSRDATGRETLAADTGAHVGAPGARSSATAGAGIKTVSKLDAAILRTQARAALTGLGWKPAIAHAAVDAALAVNGAEMTLEKLIFESLRRCPAPKA
jgi:hypothetical protein